MKTFYKKLQAATVIVFLTFTAPSTFASEDSLKKAEELKKSADSKLNADNYSGAIADFTKAIALSPQDSSLYVGRSLAHLHSTKNAEAIKDSSKALDLDPAIGQAYYIRASARKDTKEAIADFSKCIEVAPADYSLQILAHSGRAGVKNAMGDYVGAIKDYDEVLRLDSKRAVTYYLRGAIKYKLGNKSGALIDLSKAGELGLVDAYDLIKMINKS